MAGEGGQRWARPWLAARKAQAAGKKSRARQDYQSLLRRFPFLVQPRWEYAQLLMELAAWPEAERHLELLLEDGGERDDYQLALGIIMARTGRYNRAISLLNPSWLAGNYSFAYGQALYQSLLQLGRRQEALAVLETLHHLRPADRDIRLRLFSLYIELGQDQQAQPLVSGLGRPEDPALLAAIAQLHMRLELPQLAAENWQQLLAQAPKDRQAHRFLASYYLDLGRDGEALGHLRLLWRERPRDPQVARQLGQVYFRAREYGKATAFLEAYLKEDPADAPLQLMLAECLGQQGLNEAASAAYGRYLTLEREPSRRVLRQAAQAFAAAGLTEQAIRQYQLLAAQEPGRHDLALAQLHGRLGQDEQALAHWLRLAQADPADVQSRRAAVALLGKSGREQERLDLLWELYSLVPNDQEVGLELVAALLAAGKVAEAKAVFAPLRERQLFAPKLLARRGQIFQALGLSGHAYADLREAAPALSTQERPLYLTVAGEMGQLALVRQLLAAGGEDDSSSSLAMARAAALAGVGDLQGASAIYERLAGLGGEVGGEAHLAAAASYRDFGLPFAAEEELRLAWTENGQLAALNGLVELMLAEERFAVAEGWLRGLPDGPGTDRSLYELQLLNGYDQGEDVLEMADGLLAKVQGAEMRRQILIQVSRAHQGMGQDDRSRDVLLQLIAEDRYYIPAYIELVRYYGLAGERRLALQAGAEAVAMAAYDAGLLKRVYGASRQQGLVSLASQAARALVKAHPDSFGFRLILIQALTASKEYDEAVSQLRALAAGEGWQEAILSRLGLRLALAQGRYGDGLALLADRQDLDLEERVIKARLLWGSNSWSAALAEYDRVMNPPAVQEFVERCQGRQLPLPAVPPKRVWDRLVPFGGEGDNRLAMALVPEYALLAKNSGQAREASHCVNLSRWQHEIGRERTARRAVQRREYFHAVRQFEVLVLQRPEPALLFDLAGVYSELGQIGDEGVMYERIEASQPDYPGLATAAARNYLKRRPRTGLGYSFRQEEGWEGRKDIQESSYGLFALYSPVSRQDLRLDLQRLHYSPVEGDESRVAHDLALLYDTTFLHYLRLHTMAGLHFLDDGSDRGILQLRLTALAGDRFESYIEVNRRPVADTIFSVEQSIMAQDYEVGSELVLLPRLQAGGYLRHRYFSDNNHQNGYGFDLDLILRPDPDFLRLRFSYFFLDSEGGAGISTDPGTGLLGQVYWAPQNYWRNDLSIYYKHRLADDLFGWSLAGNLSAEYRFGHDSTGQSLHSGQLTLATELSTRWWLQLKGDLLESSDYRARTVAGELVYRW
ncbi:MAG: tetratricopeptide repeat protein [Thermodesulfobacteriota bacterium]